MVLAVVVAAFGAILALARHRHPEGMRHDALLAVRNLRFQRLQKLPVPPSPSLSCLEEHMSRRPVHKQLDDWEKRPRKPAACTSGEKGTERAPSVDWLSRSCASATYLARLR